MAKPIWFSLKIIHPVACWAALKWWTFCPRKSIGFNTLMEKANRRTSLSARIPTSYLLSFPTKANTKFVSFQIFLSFTWYSVFIHFVGTDKLDPAVHQTAKKSLRFWKMFSCIQKNYRDKLLLKKFICEIDFFNALESLLFWALC